METDNPISYFGVIRVNSITDSANASIQLPEHNVRTVHYPDCQQLIIYLPQYWNNYKEILIENIESKETFYQKTAGDAVNGSIQILIDSLPFPPGEFRIIISAVDDFNHIIYFTKFDESYVEKKETPQVEEPVVEPSESSIWKVYKDGFGNDIPNEDQIIREKLIKKMSFNYGKQLSYTGNLRSGTVIFTEGSIRLEFWTEMGGGNCLFYISIPKSSKWTAVTGLPINDREAIINFIAERALQDQASGCRYTITDDFITYYHR